MNMNKSGKRKSSDGGKGNRENSGNRSKKQIFSSSGPGRSSKNVDKSGQRDRDSWRNGAADNKSFGRDETRNVIRHANRNESYRRNENGSSSNCRDSRNDWHWSMRSNSNSRYNGMANLWTVGGERGYPYANPLWNTWHFNQGNVGGNHYQILENNAQSWNIDRNQAAPVGGLCRGGYGNASNFLWRPPPPPPQPAKPKFSPAEMRKKEQEQNAKAAELAKELAEQQKVAETAARLKAALSSHASAAASPGHGSETTAPHLHQHQSVPSGGTSEVTIAPLVNRDLELTAADLADIGSGRVDLDTFTDDSETEGVETRPGDLSKRLEKLVPPAQLLHGEGQKEKRIANIPAPSDSVMSVETHRPKKKVSVRAAAHPASNNNQEDRRPNANSPLPAAVVEPEVVDRFRNRLKSMSSCELRELVDSPTSQRSGLLMASLIRDHRRVLSQKINKIRFNCTQKMLVSLGENIDATDPFAEVSLDALPEELMQSISDIIKLEMPDIVICAERLTAPLDGTELPGSVKEEEAASATDPTSLAGQAPVFQPIISNVTGSLGLHFLTCDNVAGSNFMTDLRPASPLFSNYPIATFGLAEDLALSQRNVVVNNNPVINNNPARGRKGAKSRPKSPAATVSRPKSSASATAGSERGESTQRASGSTGIRVRPDLVRPNVDVEALRIASSSGRVQVQEEEEEEPEVIGGDSNDQLISSMRLITQEETRLLEEVADLDKSLQELLERRQNSVSQLSFLNELRRQMLHLS